MEGTQLLFQLGGEREIECGERGERDIHLLLLLIEVLLLLHQGSLGGGEGLVFPLLLLQHPVPF